MKLRAMKYLVGLTVFFILLVTLLPVSLATEVNLEAFIRKRTEGYMAARQARKNLVMREYYNPQEIKDLHIFLKKQYIPVKDEIKEGRFTEKYIRNSIDSAAFGEPYKEAILKCIFKNGDFEKELDQAFTKYLSSYSYTITDYKIEEVTFIKNNTAAIVKVLESRRGKDQKESKTVIRTHQWYLKNNHWFLSLENRPHL